ncbi:MAG: TonB family protein [Dysgonamonadaceae bacterium]|jgi:protein TonB|nr:TonB family protein [Dysgonamonadaceae bacterium]
MEVKKTFQADLENERTTFFLLGFTVVLSLLFILLEWSSEDALLPAGNEWLPGIVIENEYSEELPLASPAEPETTPEVPREAAPEVVYEDYNLVDETPVEPEVIPAPGPEALVPEAPVAELPPPATTTPAEAPVAEADGMPQYPGGEAAMNRYLFNHLKYPVSASSQGIEGRVWCSFIVNPEGLLTDIRVERSVYISLDQEAVRVLQTMPAWTPGTLRGRPVAVKVYLPIVFKL